MTCSLERRVHCRYGSGSDPAAGRPWQSPVHGADPLVPCPTAPGRESGAMLVQRRADARISPNLEPRASDRDNGTACVRVRPLRWPEYDRGETSRSKRPSTREESPMSEYAAECPHRAPVARQHPHIERTNGGASVGSPAPGLIRSASPSTQQHLRDLACRKAQGIVREISC